MLMIIFLVGGWGGGSPSFVGHKEGRKDEDEAV